MNAGGLKGMQFDKTINTGNLVSWGMIAAAALVSVVTTQNGQAALQKSFDERKIYVDAELKKGSEALGLSNQNAREIAAEKVANDKQDQRLDTGYKDRRDSEERQARAIAELATAQALTNAKVDALAADVRRLVEGGRREPLSPFDRNRMLIEPPWDRPFPSILRATLALPAVGRPLADLRIR